MDCKFCAVVNLFVLIYVGNLLTVQCNLIDIERSSRRLDELLVDVEAPRYSRDSERATERPQDFEYETGFVNREELRIANITTRTDPTLPESMDNYQLVNRGDDFFLASSTDHDFYLYQLDLAKGRAIYRAKLNSEKKILTFKLLHLPSQSQEDPEADATIVAILCVESRHGTELRWYRFTGKDLVNFWSWPVQDRVKRVQFFRHERQNRLVLLKEFSDASIEQLYSPIDIYRFSIDGQLHSLRLSQELSETKTFDLQVCPTYESTAMILQRRDDVVLYKYKGDKNKEGEFRRHQNVTSNRLLSVICFESGYIRYLVTFGPDTALFDFFEGEFQRDSDADAIFNGIGEVFWILSIPVNTYREESVLLVQLKNSTIIGLSWKGQGFERVSHPELNVDGLDLSRATVIPKYGFVYGNKLVEIHTELRERPSPVRDEMEKLLRTRKALDQVMRKQEVILNETETRVNQSYFTQPDVTGFWNMTDVEIGSVTIEDAVTFQGGIEIGGKTVAPSEFQSNLAEANSILDDLEAKLAKIKLNLAEAIPINSTESTLTGDVVIDGGFDVQETLIVSQVKVDKLNGIGLTEIFHDFDNHDETVVIEGLKTFESVDADYLNVGYVNDVPISNIVFDTKRSDYSKIDFPSLISLKIDGDLRFSDINDVNWGKMVASAVMKSQPTMIPGVTIVEGDLIAKNMEINRLNGLQYPGDYILANNTDSIEVKGRKKFRKLTLGTLDLDDLKTINGIPIDDYVTLIGDRTLAEEITFENFTLTEHLQINGNATGLPDTQKHVGLTLSETNTVTSDVVFAKLTVSSDLRVENSINGTDWTKLNDLVSEKSQSVEITGGKTFLKEVVVRSELTIESQRINDRSIREFVTVDTEQVFPNLTTLTGNVTLKNFTRGDFESLKKLLAENLDAAGQPQCLDKSVLFRVSPTVEHLFLNTINGYSDRDFSSGIGRTFAELRFQNLRTLTLRARGLSTINLNDENFERLKRRKIAKTKRQTITGEYDVELIEARTLDVRTVDNLSLEQVENTRIRMDDIYRGILNGNFSIDKLTVDGIVNAAKVNGEPLQSIYRADAMGTVIFPEKIRVENLTVLGFVNGINFTDFASDAVLKNDSDVVFTGRKIFGGINCRVLDSFKVYGTTVDRILDLSKHQVLAGSIKVNGTVRILNDFETHGKIGGVSWTAIRERFRYLGNNVYTLSGDLRFTSDEPVDVSSLTVTDSILDVNFDDFLDTIVYKTGENLTIHGPVIFKDRVTIDSRFLVTETFNDLNLKYFYENAVRVDRPIAVKSKVVFTEAVAVEEDLLVNDKLEAKTVGGVDLGELYANAAYVDRPSFVSGTLKLEDVIFETNIQVESLNEMNLRTVVTFESEQTLPAGSLHCMDIAVGKLDIAGTFNDQNLDDIFSDTFQLTGRQNISGRIVVVGNLLMRHDFDANFINEMNPSGFISLDGDDALNGNFVFEKPLVLRGNFFSRGPVNGVDVMRWQATAVTRSFPIQQIVKGAWTIHGNVYFEKNVFRGESLDGVNVTKLVDDLHRRDVETELMTKDLKGDLRSICEDLAVLKEVADNQIYRYKHLDYLQVFNFDRPIVSVHHFESDGFDYLLVNFDTCHLDVFVFAQTEFAAVASIPDFGLVNRWFTLHFEGVIYFLTVGELSCQRNSGNLWKLANNRFDHVEDLGNVTDARKIGESEFLLLVDGALVHRSMVNIHQRSLSKPITHEIGSESVKFVSDSRQVLLVNRDHGYEYNFDNGIGGASRNSIGTDDIVAVRLGVYRREVFLYYDENLSEDYLFVSDNNLHHRKILQAIKAQQPSSVLVLHFDGHVENLLVLVENRQRLQVYEYRGIEGFAHRETVEIIADRIYKFHLRKYSKLAKQRCIAAVQGQRLVILEAKMYGKKLETASHPCKN